MGEENTISLGQRVFGFAIMGLGILTVAWRDFLPGQPVPHNVPGRTGLAFAAGAFLLAAGVAIQIHKTAAWAAAALAAYYAVIVVVIMNGPLVVAHATEYGSYSGVAEQLSIAAGALVLFAVTAQLTEPVAASLLRIGQSAFGVCAVLFGGAHFVYMNLTAPLVPKWLPPSQLFWGYATGIVFLAAGVALLIGLHARTAAWVLTAMLLSFAVLIHEPTLLHHPEIRFNWSESALNFAILAVAWSLADALASRRRRL